MGRQRQETVQNGADSFATQLDQQGRATQIGEGISYTNPITFTYNANNLVTNAGMPGNVQLSYLYDTANRLTAATIADTGGNLQSGYAYGYDPTGWVNSINSTGVLTATQPVTLTGTLAPAPASVNLTTEGTADWVHWGLLSASYVDRKANVSAQISTYSLAAAGVAQRYNQVQTSFNWSDGTPDASSGGTGTGVSIAGLGNGFKISAPADSITTRTLHVYVGVRAAQGQITASLSDGSSPSYTDNSLDNVSGVSVEEYTFTYKAGSAGQTLNVTYTLATDHGLGIVSLLAASLSAGVTSQPLNLTHDALGHLASAGDGTHPTLSWTYDGHDNLLSELTNGTTSTSYTYSASGNTQNELQSLAVTGKSTQYYSYDQYGNTLSIGPNQGTTCPNVQSTCLSYDAQARLTGAVLANSGPYSGTTIAMGYDAAGLRSSYTVTPYGQSQPSVSEHFQYRGGQLAQTVVISGTSSYTDTYVYSQHGKPLELLRTSNGTTSRYFYLRDGLGNVVALTDLSGNVLDQYTYDVWGKPLTVSESVPQQLRYAGYWYDNELGWYWLTTRSYDPSLKRLLQPDPSEQDGLFSYVYVGDDPVDYKDPSGFRRRRWLGLQPCADDLCTGEDGPPNANYLVFAQTSDRVWRRVVRSRETDHT